MQSKKKSNKGSDQGPQNDPQKEPKKPAKKKGQHPSSLTEKESKRGKFQTLNDPQQKACIKGKDSLSSRVQALPENPLQQSSELVKKSSLHPKQTKSCPRVEEKASKACNVQTLPEDPQQPSESIKKSNGRPKRTKSCQRMNEKDSRTSNIQALPKQTKPPLVKGRESNSDDFQPLSRKAHRSKEKEAISITNY